MLKRFVWNEGGIASFKLGDDLYALGQMLKRPYMLFFNLKSINGEFDSIDLNQVPELFVIPVARDFLQRRAYAKIKTGVVPKRNPSIPEYRIRPRMIGGGGFPWKGGDLVRIDPKVGDLGMDNTVIKRDIQPNDDDVLKKYELTNIWTDGALVRRLILSLEAGENIDPLKEKIFFGRDSHGVYD